MNFNDLILQSDGVSVTVALLLLVMSVVSWFIIVYKSWLLHLAIRNLASCKALFWQAGDWSQARAHWLVPIPKRCSCLCWKPLPMQTMACPRKWPPLTS
jgi:hypothetical protein